MNDLLFKGFLYESRTGEISVAVYTDINSTCYRIAIIGSKSEQRGESIFADYTKEEYEQFILSVCRNKYRLLKAYEASGYTLDVDDINKLIQKMEKRAEIKRLIVRFSIIAFNVIWILLIILLLGLFFSYIF